MAIAGTISTGYGRQLTLPKSIEIGDRWHPANPIGTQVVAQLYAGGRNSKIWKPVEIRVHGERMGFLSGGDASRFQRRLAYGDTPDKLLFAMP